VPAGGGVEVASVCLSTVIDPLTLNSAASTLTDGLGSETRPTSLHEQVSQGTLRLAVEPLSASGIAGLSAAVHLNIGRAPIPKGTVTLTLRVAA
jgi:hypothetical protein